MDMSRFTRKLLSQSAVLMVCISAGQAVAADQGEVSSHAQHMQHQSTTPAIIHISHAEMINSEQDFIREMIPHHQEAVDTSVLLFVSTEDKDLKKLTEAIYRAQTDEILDMRISYARWYNLVPTGAMYQPMMSDLNIVTGREREIQYVKDMIMHHKGALEMAEKVLTLDGIHKETRIFAKEIIKNQTTEIAVMQDWLKKSAVSQ
jgi:uncharacterized protein (DUF305 family)